jgi:hypothetical protein
VLYALRVCHFPTSQSTRISGEVSGVWKRGLSKFKIK